MSIVSIAFYVTLLSVPAADLAIAATFGVTGATTAPPALSLTASDILKTDGSHIAALTGSASLQTPLTAPQSFDLIVPSGSTPPALATTVNGFLDPSKIDDILLVINYSIN